MNLILSLALFFMLPLGVGSQSKTSWTGTFSNGFKGATISFDISGDGKRLENLIFKGYWRCSNGTEQITIGPDKSYAIKDGKVSGIITEPENGGATAFRFDLNGSISSRTALGTLRINLNALGCDTYKLNWTAQKK